MNGVEKERCEGLPVLEWKVLLEQLGHESADEVEEAAVSAEPGDDGLRAEGAARSAVQRGGFGYHVTSFSLSFLEVWSNERCARVEVMKYLSQNQEEGVFSWTAWGRGNVGGTVTFA